MNTNCITRKKFFNYFVKFIALFFIAALLVTVVGDLSIKAAASKPGKVKLSKVTASDNKLVVKFKKVSGADGYEINVSTSSKFKKGESYSLDQGKKSTITYTISDLKAGKYYVRVRAYKHDGSGVVYGSWSKKKNCTISQKTNSDKDSYYELLDAEYQKYGRYSHFDSTVVADGYTLIADNNGANPFKNVDSFSKPCLLIKEDGSSVDLRKLDIFKDYYGYIGEGLKYACGYLYRIYYDNEGNYHFVKINMDGKVVKNVDLGNTSYSLETVSGNGDAIISENSGKKYILKSDSDKLVEMPKLNLKGEHGLSIEASRFEFIYMFYKSKVYVWAYDPNYNETMHYFDFDDLSWHECEKLVDKYNSLYQCYITIGRYAFLAYEDRVSPDYKVYDMETNSIIDNIPYAASILYFGGDSNIDMENFKWREIKISSNGKDKETLKELAEEKIERYVSTIYYMSKTHYLYQDNYGIFVRSFKKGKNDEKTVVLFDN
ncbi:MAG: fibronectin type III domain-containing protein [Lachnospiraceae bacterium]|nr:fibronectin type III domain-containing protein [Lachnospiraceae bacterium]